MSLSHANRLAEGSRKPMARSAHFGYQHPERSVQLPLERSVHAFSGCAIKARRKALRMGQRELAKIAGLALGTVNAVENEVGGGPEARRDLDEAERREMAKLLRFCADVVEGVA